MISPVYDSPLLLVEGREKVLVASDIHLGLEHELMLGGIRIPSQTWGMKEQLMASIASIRPDRLILLGDVKHNVPRTSRQERSELPGFLSALASRVRVDLVPGNHDGELADMAPPGVRMRPSTGFLLDDVGYFHGHTWPDERVVNAKCLVAGHLHPAIRLSDPLGHCTARPVWVRAPLSTTALLEQYGPAALSVSEDRESEDREIIILPAYNRLCGGLPLNERDEVPRGPLPALADWDRAKLYLLDGTDLGSLAMIRRAEDKPDRSKNYLQYFKTGSKRGEMRIDTER